MRQQVNSHIGWQVAVSFVCFVRLFLETPMTMGSQVCDDHDELMQLFVYFCVPFCSCEIGWS